MPSTTRKGGRAWRRIRAYVLERDHGQCQLRYPTICILRATEVDHIEAVVDNPTRELDTTNLRAVCIPCHKHRTGLQASGNDQAPHVPPSRHW